MSGNERDVLKHQADALNISHLEKIDSVIKGYFDSLEKKFLADSLSISTSTDKFSQYLKNEPLIKNGIIFEEGGEVGKGGKRIFPVNGGILSEKERAFIEKTKMFIEDRKETQINYSIGQRKTQSYSKGGFYKSISSSQVSSKQQRQLTPNNNKDSLVEKYGWYTWFSGAEQNHIFWWKSNGKTYGVEVFHARIISDIISLLPTSSGSLSFQEKRHQSESNSLIKLIDNNGELIYQWGTYIPNKNEKYSAAIMLSKPLGSWRLECYAEEKNLNPIFNLFNVLSTLVIITAVLGGLALYLYREHRREITLGRQRVNFVSQVSHELKTPLTNIRMYAELLEERIDDDISDDEADKNTPEHRYIDIISSESQRLSRLIANILNFSKSAKSGLKIHKREGEIDTVIQAVLSKFQASLEAKEFVFDLQLNAKNEVLFDHDALEQILNNLFSNVEKYASEGKYLQVKSDQGHGITTIVVMDKGVGISLSEQQNIFKPFYRISSKLTDGVSGTGIGLGIAKELAALHGGNLKLVPSESGAMFRLEIETPEVA